MKRHSLLQNRSGIRAISVLMAAGALILAQLACSVITGGGLVGQWAKKGSDLCEMVVAFKSNGTVIYTMYSMDFSGTYEKIDDNTIRVEMKGMMAPWQNELIEFQVEGDTLTLIVDGVRTEYERTRVNCN